MLFKYWSLVEIVCFDLWINDWKSVEEILFIVRVFNLDGRFSYFFDPVQTFRHNLFGLSEEHCFEDILGQQSNVFNQLVVKVPLLVGVELLYCLFNLSFKGIIGLLVLLSFWLFLLVLVLVSDDFSPLQTVPIEYLVQSLSTDELIVHLFLWTFTLEWNFL